MSQPLIAGRASAAGVLPPGDGLVEIPGRLLEQFAVEAALGQLRRNRLTPPLVFVK